MEARVLFKAGKNRDGYFSNEELLSQVDEAITIFESRTHGFYTGLFLFDNAPSHQRRPADGLSARKMTKNPNENWCPKQAGIRMRNGELPDGREQEMYFPADHPEMPGWFKGMEIILRERGLWRDRLKAQCEGFKCSAGSTTCCCRRILFCQPDFTNQKSALEELVTSRGHICDFYPKFHCELNFIEQYWGMAKSMYRVSPPTDKIEAMEKNVLACLDSISRVQINRYVMQMLLYKDEKFSNPRTVLPTGLQDSWMHT
jgi:hypothetical protein